MKHASIQILVPLVTEGDQELVTAGNFFAFAVEALMFVAGKIPLQPHQLSKSAHSSHPQTRDELNLLLK